MVFNIAEGMHGFGRQALVPALLEAYQIPYTFSDPLTLAVTLHKTTAKRVVRDQGILTPEFEVITAPDAIEHATLPFPLFIKPIAEGTSKGISEASRIFTRSELRMGCERLLKKFQQPVLVEAFLPGREFTVGILGTGSAAYALGAMEILPSEDKDSEVYSFANKRDSDRQVSLATDAAGIEAMQTALAAWNALGCRDGGRVDLRCGADGRVNFLEANPLAGLNPDESDLIVLSQLKGMAYIEVIKQIVDSALRRAWIESNMNCQRVAPHVISLTDSKR
jgi:D-alanine-D-alanine ligase